METAGTAASIVDSIDDIRVKEGQRSYRFAEWMGLKDDFQFDLNGDRVGISAGIERVSMACDDLTKRLNRESEVGLESAGIKAAKLEALLAYHTFFRGIDTRVRHRDVRDE